MSNQNKLVDVSQSMELVIEKEYAQITKRIEQLDKQVDRYEDSGRTVPYSIINELEQLNKKASELKKQFGYILKDEECEIIDKLVQSSSNEALGENIATEIEAGKSKEQAAAIAYSVQRKNDGFGGEIQDVSGMVFRGDDGKKYQMANQSYAIYSPQHGGYYSFNGQKGVPYCPVGGKSALKKILEDGGFLSMEGMRIVKPIKDSKCTKIVDVTASNSSELTKIINKFLASNPGFKHEDIDIRGNILSGTFRIAINGGDVLVNYNPETGGIIQHTLRVDRNENTVTQQQVNEMVRKLYEHSNKVKEAQQVKGPAELLYCIIEFTESNYYGLTSKVGKQLSVDEVEKLIKNADEARRNDKNKPRGTYDKTWVDIVVKWGKHKYRIHFLRFDIGGGAQYMNVKQQVNALLPRVPEFMTNASYKSYVKQLDRKCVMDKSEKLAEYKKVENGDLVQGMLLKHDLGFVFISSDPKEDKDLHSLAEAEQYIKSKNYNKIV